jgi:hypothetical protein
VTLIGFGGFQALQLTAGLSGSQRYGSHSIATKEEKHAAIRNTGLPVFEFLLGTGIRQFSTLYDECLGSGVSTD